MSENGKFRDRTKSGPGLHSLPVKGLFIKDRSSTVQVGERRLEASVMKPTYPA
jgi:hypothetical protein